MDKLYTSSKRPLVLNRSVNIVKELANPRTLKADLLLNRYRSSTLVVFVSIRNDSIAILAC
ncbi:MAG: hypothetical protein C5B55_03130 [Blastocatellia bacterium]|nr:MAG: hypothetical protein C5B55_03130 [Blastocatellia bacterium]